MREPVGLILAGGRGTRMGGVRKADLRLGGVRLLERCAERLAPQVDALAVNSNAPVQTDLPIVPDTVPGFAGPLAGILAGLGWAERQGATHLVTVAVDTPFFPCDLVPRLLLARANGGAAIAATSDGKHGTFGLWPVDQADDLAQFIAKGGRKVTAFTDTQDAALAQFPDTDPPAFFNINTPEDLIRAEGWL